jgi:hypothetical protein
MRSIAGGRGREFGPLRSRTTQRRTLISLPYRLFTDYSATVGVKRLSNEGKRTAALKTAWPGAIIRPFFWQGTLVASRLQKGRDQLTTSGLDGGITTDDVPFSPSVHLAHRAGGGMFHLVSHSPMTSTLVCNHDRVDHPPPTAVDGLAARSPSFYTSVWPHMSGS